MREWNFATEQSIVEAYEELQENFGMDIEAEMERSGKYKRYPEVLTDTTMSPAFR